MPGLKKRRYKVAWDGHTLADPGRLMDMERIVLEAGGRVRLCIYEPAWEGGYFTFLAEFDNPRTAGRVGSELRRALFSKPERLAGVTNGKGGSSGEAICTPTCGTG